MCHGKLVRLTLHIINFLIWVCAVLLIVFGAIGVASPSTTINMLTVLPGVSFITVILNIAPFLEGTSIFMIVLGSILFLYTFFACFAVHKGHGFMMKMYWLSLICGFLAEVALIIFSGVYPGTTEATIQQQMYSSLTTNFTSVSLGAGGLFVPQPNNTEAGAWEQLQYQTQCCGAYGFADYYTLSQAWNNVGGSPKIPPTCCTYKTSLPLNYTSSLDAVGYSSCQTATADFSTTPCSDIVMNTLYDFNYIAIGISAGLLVIQMLSTILAILLRKCDSTEYV